MTDAARLGQVVSELGLTATGRPLDPDLQLLGAAIDSRRIAPGAVFAALEGTRGHGAAFAAQAHEQGAVAMLAGADAPPELLERAGTHLPVLLSPGEDGVSALGRLARVHRRACAWPVVAITGSSGKTSTKDALAALAAREFAPVVASPANHNNEIGAPLTLLSAPVGAGLVICEMGMRGLGQIAYLCEIAEPDVGVVTNAGSAHLELLGSLDAIVHAKAEMVAGVRPEGAAVVPADQPGVLEAATARPATVLTFGEQGGSQPADCEVAAVEHQPDGISGLLAWRGTQVAFRAALHGRHHARNLAAAVCAYRALGGSGAQLEDSFREIRHAQGRGGRRTLPDGGLVIDDAYNANPESMAAALETLAAVPTATRRVAVLGRMAKLGRAGPDLHRDVGARTAHAGVDVLVVVGSGPEPDALAEGYRTSGGRALVRFPDVESALRCEAEWRQPGDTVLVKASNSTGLAALAAAIGAKVATGVGA